MVLQYDHRIYPPTQYNTLETKTVYKELHGFVFLLCFVSHTFTQGGSTIALPLSTAVTIGRLCFIYLHPTQLTGEKNEIAYVLSSYYCLTNQHKLET